jgi:hypothetical protein
LKYLLAKNQVAIFYLARLKSASKGRHFWDATDIIKNATEELKRGLQTGLQQYFQHRYSRCQKLTAAQRDCSEGNVA